MHITIDALAEAQPGPRWQERFQALWPKYHRWYLAEGHVARPTYLECERAMRRHMPEFVPTWERLVELAGGGDLEARFLSLYRPPPYLTGCSQAVWSRDGDEPLLVRNYDYSPHVFERMIWRTEWNARPVIAVSDCLIGALDGINDAGLAVSLNFGGARDVGDGFGAPMVLRYQLEFCSTVSEAARVLRRIPIHMAYNILMLDGRGDFVTAFTAPGKPTILHRIAASTNHQDRVAWPRHAEATATLDRERRLYEMLNSRAVSRDDFVGNFLRPPLFQTKYDHGYGTLYTAIYRPSSGQAEYRWQNKTVALSLTEFNEQSVTVDLAAPASTPPQ
jgi:predicted choloylglycine hydrolase